MSGTATGLGSLRRRGRRLADIYVAARALVALVAVELGLRTSTLPTVARRVGASLEPLDGNRDGAPLTAREWRTIRVTRAVVRRWPFARGPCLRESLVIAALLDPQRRPVLRVGVRRVDDQPIGHAWLEFDGITVGEPADRSFSFGVGSAGR